MYDCEGCGRRRREGLFFGSGREAKWWCSRCQSADQKELASSLDDRSRGVLTRDADGVDWPYGPNIYVRMRADLLDWADQHDLKSGNTGCSSGLHWLDKGRCAKRECHDRPRGSTTTRPRGFPGPPAGPHWSSTSRTNRWTRPRSRSSSASTPLSRPRSGRRVGTASELSVSTSGITATVPALFGQPATEVELVKS